jgi:hypothetical protein
VKDGMALIREEKGREVQRGFHVRHFLDEKWVISEFSISADQRVSTILENIDHSLAFDEDVFSFCSPEKFISMRGEGLKLRGE